MEISPPRKPTITQLIKEFSAFYGNDILSLSQ